ncbi:helix-turn-helix domain-containing protein [Maribellus maritimus]|uniref:helix-turn-helix domain-containing protein n=1 Tax=Maribellus maritimus TaxID=2870838 RepID=UPI001EEAEDD0|nr:AraC family transcriptional regulator [Maribellus maritimus]MCG6188495.1 helix-turn-helix transcriptional regulator [Maribellus maritimus]
MHRNEILHVKNISQYYDISGLGKPRHPLVAIYSFSEIPKIDIQEPIRFTLGLYVVTIKRECNFKSQYGQTSYDYDEGVMGFTAPNQVFKADEDFYFPEQGWCLIFHPDFLLNYELARKIRQYHFFDYAVSEALILSEDEERDIVDLFQKIKQEIDRPIDKFSQDVLIAQLDLLLTYSNRFYNRQFITRKPLNNHLLSRFENLLEAFFSEENRHLEGLPTVSYFASKLNISSKYFSDMLKQLTGLTAQQHIHEKLIEKAKEKLSATNLSVSEIAYELGFEHPQSFSKLFKTKTNVSPLEFRQSFN